MTLYIKHEDGATITATVTLHAWTGDSWGCDFFQDAETSLRDGQELTPDEYQEVLDYWQGEVDTHNAGERTEQFGDPADCWETTYDDLGNPVRVPAPLVEYGFFHDEAAE